MLYFAYGSNLDPAQMKRRCPEMSPVGIAALFGWRLAFGGYSRTRGGAVATIKKAKDRFVDGFLYVITKDDLASLDRAEGHPHYYKRRFVNVVVESGDTVKACTYVLDIDKEGAPTREYYNILKKSYQRLGFDVYLLAEVANV